MKQIRNYIKDFLKFIALFFYVIVLRTPIQAQQNQLILIEQHKYPVLSVRSKGAEKNKWGFEGGRVIKLANQYHLFTSEMIGDPIWTNMLLAYWVSNDGLEWTRVSTLKKGSGDFTGNDPRAALWSPIPIFDSLENRWNLFYISYKSSPSLPTNFLGNHQGQVWRSISKTKGINGLKGPYKDVNIVLKPDHTSAYWEGLQGTDSFFPYQIGNMWVAIYGSAQTEYKPVKSFLVGMAESQSTSISGPWKRLNHLSPLPIEDYFIENPIITPAPNGGYICVYDCNTENSIGWAYSKDGFTWEKGNKLNIQPTSGLWSKDIRTPMGLVYEGNNKFTIFYSGFESLPDWNRLLTGKGKETCAIGKILVEWK